MTTKTKIFSVFIFVFIFGLGVYFAQAAGTALQGYAWSENIGWVSFNCSNNNSCAAVNYSVSVDEANGKFSGYGWSENIGWIDFAPNGPYPASPNNSAEINFASGQVSGWARIVSLKDYSNSGWIKLKDGNYGVVLSAGKFDGYAWSDEIGWIDFSPQYSGVEYSCYCGGWTNSGCGVSPCAASEMTQTRSCTPTGCLAETQCVPSAACVHTECDAVRQCVVMPGAGSDSCANSDDCIPKNWRWWETAP